MLETFAIAPEVFDKSSFEHRASANILINLLEELGQFGLIADLNKSQWKRAVHERVEQMPPKYKYSVQALLSGINDRIIRFPKVSNEQSDNPVFWQQVILNTDREHGLDGIFIKHEEVYQAYLSDDRISHYEDSLVNPYLKRSKQNPVQCDMTHDGLTELLSPILKHANFISIIDPYFGKEGKIENTISTLHIVSDLLGKRNEHPLSGTIEVHTTYEAFKNLKIDTIKNKLSNHFKKMNSRHELSVFIYGERADTPRFHNRYIRTKHALLTSGESFGASNKGKTNEIALTSVKNYIQNEHTNMVSVAFNINKAKTTAEYYFCIDKDGNINNKI